VESVGEGALFALVGPRGAGYPQAVALRETDDFREWPLRPGDRGALLGGAIELRGALGTVVVDLSAARRLRAATMPRIASLGKAFDACLVELGAIQAVKGCELRIGGLVGEGGSPGGVGAVLEAAAKALGLAAREAAARGEVRSAIEGAVSGLLGLGQGLTPSGDDFLCGFLGAARCAAPDLAEPLGAAVCAKLGSTTAISASLLRCAVRGLFHSSLEEFAAALAADDALSAASRLRACCDLGHSSGADLAAGFLYGLAVLADGSERRSYAP